MWKNSNLFVYHLKEQKKLIQTGESSWLKPGFAYLCFWNHHIEHWLGGKQSTKELLSVLVLLVLLLVGASVCLVGGLVGM